MTAAPESLRPGISRLCPSTPGAILEGMTVIALLVLTIGFGVRYATAAAGNAGQSSADSQIAALAPAIQAYYLDHETYGGMTTQTLGLVGDASRPLAIRISDLSDAGFCVEARSGDWYAAQSGPHGQIRTARQPLCP